MHDHLDLDGLRDGQIARRCATHDPVDVAGCTSVQFDKVHRERHQAAAVGNQWVTVERGQPRLGGQIDEQRTMTAAHRIPRDEKGIESAALQRGEDALERRGLEHPDLVRGCIACVTFRSKATRFTPGCTARSKSSRFWIAVMPPPNLVIFPPGLALCETMPQSPGSPPVTNTLGIFVLARFGSGKAVWNVPGNR
jgi:hypothetical protein